MTSDDEIGSNSKKPVPKPEMATGQTRAKSLDDLPPALLATIMAKLDVASIFSAASTCTAFRTCASQLLSFLPTIHLLVSQFLFLIKPRPLFGCREYGRERKHIKP